MIVDIVKSSFSETISDVKEMIYLILPIFAIFLAFNILAEILDSRKKKKRQEIYDKRQEIRAKIDEINLQLAEIRLRKEQAMENARLEYEKNLAYLSDYSEQQESEQYQKWLEDLDLIIAEFDAEEEDLEQQKKDAQNDDF